jgi:enoyl-CoA hydratase/carnithine racemase
VPHAIGRERQGRAVSQVGAGPPAKAYERIRLGLDGRIAQLTLARPDKLNALDPPMLEELLDALERVGRSPASALVLAATGRAFCAGVDLASSFFMEGVEAGGTFAGQRLLAWQHELIQAIYDLPQVSICALNGDAVGGGGFGMAMACDMRFAVPEARFWMIPIKVDVVQDFGLTWFLQRAIGPSRTMEMLMTGRAIGAAEAERWGFVNAVVQPTELMTRVMEVADAIASAGPDAVRLSKQVVRHGAQVDLRAELHHEAVANGLCFHSTEFLDKQRAFRERALGSRRAGA